VSRPHNVLLIASTLLASWLGMQAVHELGHILGAWLTGGRVAAVWLHPLSISRTDLATNPQPLMVVWAGPVGGVILPLMAWALAARLRLSAAFVLRFFAGFCLIANGAYIAFGSFARAGDAGVMLQQGSSPWQLWLFGALTLPAGLWLWHRQGRHFGLGPQREAVNPRLAYATLTAAVLLLLLGVLISGS
jgi:hypothetical protein